MDENNPLSNIQPSQPAQAESATPINSQPPKTKKATFGLIKKIIIILILLLVIAAAVIFGQRYYKAWQAKQRDSQRKADIQDLQKALESIRPRTQDQKYYPGDITESTMVKTGAMSKLPKDPLNKPPYIYLYQGRPIGCTATCTGYILFACLENAKDPQGQAPKATCQTKIYEVSK